MNGRIFICMLAVGGGVAASCPVAGGARARVKKIREEEFFKGER